MRRRSRNSTISRRTPYTFQTPGLHMPEQVQVLQRYYPSPQYLLPADEKEAIRLDAQHLIIVKAFENRLSLAPLTLTAGDKVLESAAGSGIWALEFAALNIVNGAAVDIECIDISSRQFPSIHPAHIHFSVQSVANLPYEWTNTFAYAHQRLIVLAMNASLWRSAISEMYRVLRPGGWLELVEFETERFHCGVGPSSNKLCSLVDKLFAEKGIIQDVSVYLCPLLEEVGFIDVQSETRDVPVGGRRVVEGGNGYTGEEWGEGWMGIKVPVVNGGGYGVVNTAEEFDGLLQNSVREWNNSKEVHTSFYTILARKPPSS
ncbi:hypothetical protein J3R30DRAFT_3532531 [Lentinula aciculospora]|uniref:Methyltransferase domain-containing protein n=1 Tax=Lentinula aciculospora TaxID=153920 RepID=A0A9W9A086_9AGAR|nr:hypothetical protein J3R30DRAFT_3532531 [Lentinula aciculospora]